MNKKIFYGEYTLLHWIELILKHNIILPDYQRGFVWPKENVESIVGSFKDGSFVPPVVIGTYKQDKITKNIILDGQQRLTSLLLSYIKLYPKFEDFKKPIENIYQDDEEYPLDDTPLPQEKIEWNFDILLRSKDPYKLMLTREEIREGNRDDLTKYENLPSTCCLTDEELEKHYLGFSYIVPMDDNETAQQAFYSRLFRDINILGVNLENQESRRALYYLNPELTSFFEPSIVSGIHIKQNNRSVKIDFVRSLAFCSQYKHDDGEEKIAKGCRKQVNLENYYADYIDSVINGRHIDVFGNFQVYIGISNIQARLSSLDVAIKGLHFNKVYESIIDADLTLLGLIYYIVYENKKIELTDYDTIKSTVKDVISTYKTSSEYDSHRRSPNALRHLRDRIKRSIGIYSDYAK